MREKCKAGVKSCTPLERRLVLLFFFAHRAQVDAKLLGFLVEMAAFKVQRASGGRYVVLVATEFGEDDIALKRLHAIGERAY